MDWQNIIMIVLTVLLLGVWLPALVISVRKAMRNDKRNKSIKTNSDGSKTQTV